MAERGRILEQDDDARAALRRAHRVAVIGIKPESRAAEPAYYVPRYLERAGYDVIPVPVYYPEVTEILGKPVYRSLAEVPGPIDLVVLFRRSEDVMEHVEEIIAARPQAVWMQQGIVNAAAAERFVAAGMDVVQDRCTMTTDLLS